MSSNPREAKFLASRKHREQQLKRSVNHQDRLQWISQFTSEVTALRSRVDLNRLNDLTKDETCQLIDDATEQWCLLHELLQQGSQSHTVPAHELARLSTLLKQVMESIGNWRTKQHSQDSTFHFDRTKTIVLTDEEEERDFLELIESSSFKQQPDLTRKTQRSQQKRTLSTKNTQSSSSHNLFAHYPSGSTVHLPFGLKTAFIRDMSNILLLSPPIDGSVLIQRITDSHIIVAAHQIRLQNCHNCSLYVCSRSSPIMESSTRISWGPFWVWTGLDSFARHSLNSTVEELLRKANLSKENQNSYQTIENFSRETNPQVEILKDWEFITIEPTEGKRRETLME